MKFNTNSRLKNIILSSSFGVVEQITIYLLTFVYRTVFLLVLSKEYLGISGLFTDVLKLLSLSELGIGSVICFRLYKPIMDNDIELCQALMLFYKRVYIVIGFVVLVLGICFFPFVNTLISEKSVVPDDVSLNSIYILFVLQSVFSYFFVYSQSFLIADQKNYVISAANIIYCLISTILKILVLVIAGDYTLSIIVEIIVNLIYTFIFSKIIKNKYADIFKSKKSLSKIQMKEIIDDTSGLMCHKIGYVILNSTDSIILSKFIGLAELGLYSNYSLISVAIDVLLNKLLAGFVSTIGNLSLECDDEKTYDAYSNMLFLNYWLVSICTICYFSLINPFIEVWLGKDYLLDIYVVLAVSVNMFFNSSGITNVVFINANGLFVKDKIRPLIQVIINLVVSIVLVKLIGISGVFLGTFISIFLTSWWRQPILVFKYIFKKNPLLYFAKFGCWFIITLVFCVLYYFLFKVMPTSFGFFIIKFILCFFVTNVIYFIVFSKNKSFNVFRKFVLNWLNSCDRG